MTSCPSLSRSSLEDVRQDALDVLARAPHDFGRRRGDDAVGEHGQGQPLEIVGRAPHVRDVQVGALLEADVDERGLHPGEHPFDAAFIDVAGDPSFALAFDVELAEEPIFDEGYAGLRAVGVDHQEAMRHGHALGGDEKLLGATFRLT